MAERPADHGPRRVLLEAFCRDSERWHFHECFGAGVVGEQRFHFAAQRTVSGARVVEKRAALTRVSLESSLVQSFHRGPAFHSYSVLRNAISAALSGAGRSSPKSWPFTARVVTPYPLNPVGT